MYKIWGKVRRGQNRGKKLGYPTANLTLRKEVPQGIYISKTTIGGTTFPSVSFVGNAKTYGEKEVRLETHIFSFNKNIYNMWISIRLIKKIRENKKFDSGEDLARQIKKDVEITKEYFKNV